MIGFFEQKPGHKSMMRLIAFIASIMGVLLLLTGIFLAIYIVFNNKGDFVMLPTAFITTGGLLTGASEAAKAIQSRFEDRGNE